MDARLWGLRDEGQGPWLDFVSWCIAGRVEPKIRTSLGLQGSSDMGFAFFTSDRRFFYLRLSLELSISEFLCKDLSWDFRPSPRKAACKI